MTTDDSLFPKKILDHGDLADLPAVGLDDADLHLNPLQRQSVKPSRQNAAIPPAARVRYRSIGWNPTPPKRTPGDRLQ